jgi:hypothetical protein
MLKVEKQFLVASFDAFDLHLKKPLTAVQALTVKKKIIFSFNSAFLSALGRAEILESIVAHIGKMKPCTADISESLESQHSNINICISISVRLPAYFP